MLRRFYTVMIVPHEGGALRRLSVSMNFIVSMAAIFLFCFVSSAFLAQFFLGGMHRIDSSEKFRVENERLALENARLRQDLTQTVTKVDALSDAIENFKTRDPQWTASDDDGMGGGAMDAEDGPDGLFTADGDLHVTARNSREKVDYWKRVLDEHLCELDAATPKLPVEVDSPSRWPLQGTYRITSGYGIRRDPFDGTRQFHEGIDLATTFGEKVTAAAAGVVIEARRHGGYGNMVLIDHGDGLATLYGHLRRSFVQEGQKVSEHDVIGEVGSTGRSTGPHLHFEVLQEGKPVDPMRVKRFASLH